MGFKGHRLLAASLQQLYQQRAEKQSLFSL
jgi:hypothetical protein